MRELTKGQFKIKKTAIFSIFAILVVIFVLNVCQCGWFQTSISHKFSEAEISALLIAAENGDSRAEEDLGRAYAFGNGVLQSTSQAKKWLTKSAEQGNAGVLFTLGSLYDVENHYDALDAEQAYFWYSIACVRGYGFAFSNRDRNSVNLRNDRKKIIDARVDKWLLQHPSDGKPAF